MSDTQNETPKGGLSVTALQSTGQLRSLLANAALSVINGSMEIEKATMLHKLSKNISDSLYSETKIAMFRREAGMKPTAFGKLPLGDPSD